MFVGWFILSMFINYNDMYIRSTDEFIYIIYINKALKM